MNPKRFKGLLLAPLFLLITTYSYSQRYIIESGSIAFFSKATIEDIKSENKKVSSIFNISSGSVAFSMPIREFHFDKQLMQEHFNDKYMESDKFPSSTFAGVVTGYVTTSTSDQQVRAKGKLTIHGVTREVDVPGTFQFTNGQVILKSSFKIKLDDYNIKIPKLLWQNIAEQVDVMVNFTYKQQ